ncbi:Hydroxymethylpyrimidine/phosphomethylpyrimidine kinase [Pirellula sp. SH-Sr6A]|uniref:bifunctional hydroxymethylpyrimidine kinase/phosphomethylpyrimidine kinase n=1 Tax=Pirellula sp. SH-Sr6A TaxID=1632865 RepID=UPI00078DF1EF|nr:bifunctional hydroxymethylpyrimidine kinase/phosphomethylpyrimidine kinase [Pirellula sp. SH-Sr6A]AMV30838.1 Hydroxymethylpyrimidine/phosphomethylpyrimidine kinase [Pirellula sp. SH-Sr6A]
MIAKHGDDSGDDSGDVITLSPHCVALTIAGSDPSGGAGLQADLKTFQQLGVYGMSVVTLVTVQNTLGVRRVEVLTPDLVIDQIRAVREDIEPLAVKTGALGSVAIVEAVSAEMATVPVPVVVDPVLVSKHGDSLADESVVVAYKDWLLPHATLVTPNRFEAEMLSGVSVDSEKSGVKAARVLRDLGAECVLIKMGACEGKSLHVLAMGDQVVSLWMPRLDANNTHGTGCILSAAIACGFAKGNGDVQEVVEFGLQEVFKAIHVNTGLGRGIHPAEVRALGS